jgi:hypothetical protein
MTLFVDTNFFLQCKPINEILWNEISDDDIEILITRPVQIEIDRLKNDGNSRRSKKARSTNSLFRNMLSTPETQIQYKVNEISIILKFSNPYSEEQLKTIQDNLDTTYNDDKILAEVKYFIKENGTEGVFFVSHDTNPLLTAKRNNIPFKQIPDSWLLPPENDARDKEIIQLRDQVKTLMEKEPIIQTKMAIHGELFIDYEFNVSINEYIELNTAELEEIIDRATEKHPLKTDFTEELKQKPQISLGQLINEKYIPPDQTKIDKYKNEEYPKWKNDLKEFFNDHCKTYNQAERFVPCGLTVENIGSRPVDNLIIEISVFNDAVLYQSDIADLVSSRTYPPFPRPPEPPKGFWKQTSPLWNNENLAKIIKIDSYANTPLGIPHIENLTRVRDKYAFYWLNKPESTDKIWKFECNEFRHKIEPELFSLNLGINGNLDEGKVNIKVKISGSNLSEPFEVVYKLKFTIKKKNAYDDLIKLI